MTVIDARVRLYHLGTRQLLRKGESAAGRSSLGVVCARAVSGDDRIFAADLA